MTRFDDKNVGTVTADVYADDLPRAAPLNEAPGKYYSYAITADADADGFARVASIFNLANTAPRSVVLRRAEDDTVYMDVTIGPLKEMIADMIRRKTGQLTCVTSVEMRSTGE